MHLGDISYNGFQLENLFFFNAAEDENFLLGFRTSISEYYLSKAYNLK